MVRAGIALQPPPHAYGNSLKPAVAATSSWFFLPRLCSVGVIVIDEEVRIVEEAFEAPRRVDSPRPNY